MPNGIIAAGNWIIDHVKIINTWPNVGMLADIQDEFLGTGGAPYNVLMDLARLQVDIPLHAVGVIGNDPDGEYILNDLKNAGITTDHLTRTDQAATSYTDVMTETGSGHRTFFHCRGANALLDVEHFEPIRVKAKMFHLGYLLLLDKLDAPDPDYGVKAARVLDLLQQKGYKTSVDVVSVESGVFRNTVVPCLKYVDYLIFNEIEAGYSTGLKIRTEDDRIDTDLLEQAAQKLLDQGVRELVIIHFPEAGFALTKTGAKLLVPSFKVSQDEIKGTVGAGDAFCAGVLYSIHQGLSLEETLKLGHASARFNLTDPTSTGGAVSLKEIQSYISQAQLRDLL
jgi:sugar/nucleoside kinase (ribokinase family)